MAATVTIDKEYFNTLLRRAEFHTNGEILATPAQSPTVNIPKNDHDTLLRMAREYTLLRAALISGGVEPGTLDILISGNSCFQPMTDQPDAESVRTIGGRVPFERPQSNPIRISVPSPKVNASAASQDWSIKTRSGSAMWRDRGAASSRQHSFSHDGNSFPFDSEKDEKRPVKATEKQRYVKVEQRTILMRNLSERTTHKDLEDVVRGGAVLDLYLRSNEKSASVSFVEGSAAQAFMDYTKRNDIYIHSKKVEFLWNDRQFKLPGHVAGKIQGGATRNLIIRGVQPNVTSERIREDLNHIHNLVVIGIVFQQGDAVLFLNSVHNSLFARSCMISRSFYKSMRIEFYPDECAQPLLQPTHSAKRETFAPLSKKITPTVNRFQMLNMDNTEDSSETEEDNLGRFSPVSQGVILRAKTVST